MLRNVTLKEIIMKNVNFFNRGEINSKFIFFFWRQKFTAQLGSLKFSGRVLFGITGLISLTLLLLLSILVSIWFLKQINYVTRGTLELLTISHRGIILILLTNYIQTRILKLSLNINALSENQINQLLSDQLKTASEYLQISPEISLKIIGCLTINFRKFRNGKVFFFNKNLSEYFH